MNPQTWRILQKFCAEGAKVIINNYNYVSFRELSEENQEGLFGLFHSVFPDRKTSNTEIELLKKSGILTLEKSKKIHNEKTTIEKYTYQVTEDKQEYLYLIPDKENPKAMQGALQWTKKEYENHFIIKRAPVFNKFLNKFGFSSEVFFDENHKFVPRKTRMPLSKRNQYDLVFVFDEKFALLSCLDEKKIPHILINESKTLLERDIDNEYPVLKVVFENIYKDKSDENLKNFVHQVLFHDTLRQELSVINKDLGKNVLEEYSNHQLWPILTKVFIKAKDYIIPPLAEWTLFPCFEKAEIPHILINKSKQLLENDKENTYPVLKKIYVKICEDKSDENLKNFVHQVLFRDTLRQELSVVDKDLGINVLKEYSNAQLWPILTKVFIKAKEDLKLDPLN